jgi:minor extracellular serine protease Vpr
MTLPATPILFAVTGKPDKLLVRLMCMLKAFSRRALSGALFFSVLSISQVYGQVPRPPIAKRQMKVAKQQFASNRYIVFLQDPPVSARYAAREQMSTAAAVGYRGQVMARQRTVMTEMATRNIPVTGSVNTLLNAIFVSVGPERLSELRAIPGVLGVMPERVMKKSLNKAVALANGQQAWAQLGGQSSAGKGIKIAILDTGIDITHPAFQDSSLSVPAGFPKCNKPPSYTGLTDPQYDCKNFTNSKVIVARSYVPQIAVGGTTLNAATSSPDDYSARDRDGHGTAVASAAAANQNSAGAIAFSGMAPKAYLGNYKIWGTEGVNDNPPESVWIQAIEDALSDGMDVANMSSGGPAFTGATDVAQCGNPAGVPCDPLAAAFEAAAKAGMVITVSAGNAADNTFGNGQNYTYFNSISSPATAPSVIAVGGTLSSHALGSLVTAMSSSAPASLKSIAAQRSDSCFGWDPASQDCTIFLLPPSISPGLTAPMVDVTTTGDNGQACSALPANSLNGKFVLIQRGGGSACTFDAKVENATAAGAIGVVLYMADSSATITPEFTDFIFVPAVMISLADGTALKTYIDANPNTPVRIDTAGQEQTLSSFNQLLSFSSLGPAPDGIIKPDIVATGGYDSSLGSIDPSSPYSPSYNGMYLAVQSYEQSAELYSATGYAGADGTSFSAPLVAGAAALVKQAHPTWTPGQIKSALLNNAAQDVATDDFGDPVDVQWIGAGRLDANAAVSATVTAEPSTLSFGFLKSGVALPGPITLTVTNQGSASVTLAVAVAPGVSASGATVSVSQPSITLAAGAKTTLTVTLAGSVPTPGEYNGAITLKSATPAVNMHVPYMFIVGDGVPVIALPLFGCCYGQVGADLGSNPIQVLDQYGAPVVGANVAYTISPAAAVTLKSVTGVPGGTTGSAFPPFAPVACTPASNARAVTCPTNNYGISWVEVIGGSATTSTATVTAAVGPYTGNSALQFGVTLLPAASILTGGIANAGSFQTTVAPGSYASIFGSNMMDPNYLFNATGDISNTVRMPLSLDNVTVTFDAPASGSLPAISVPAHLFFVSPGQINIYVPWELEGYPSAQVKTTFAEFLHSNLSTVAMNNYTPAFLMNSGTVADAVDNTTGALITAANPATAGQILQLYCNGLGPVSPQPATGDPAPSAEPLSRTPVNAVVTIGGKQAQVFFSGLAPGFVGEYLVDIAVPAGLTPGNQPITVAIGGVTSPTTVAGSTVYLPVK